MPLPIYHGQVVRDDRPLSWWDHTVRCDACGGNLTSAEQQALTCTSLSTSDHDHFCDDCEAGATAALLPFA